MIEAEIEPKEKTTNQPISPPLVTLVIFLLLTQIANAIYTAHNIEPSSTYSTLSAFGFLWVVGWWIKDDNRKYGLKLVYDLGLFLYLAWVFVIPYYLFKTRGRKAFVTLGWFLLLYFFTYLIGVMVFFFLI